MEKELVAHGNLLYAKLSVLVAKTPPPNRTTRYIDHAVFISAFYNIMSFDA